ncbi:MAG: phenylalanine--tRNA ligase subunit beta [Planctomycetota bacterium]|nr:MAG: phenylalanine--tRNA ligase subunit beta [Planctomycetota bacterium]
MRVSLNWVGEFVDLSGVAPAQVAELLALHTAEVEGVEEFGAAIGDVVVGEVVHCDRHPNADKLSVTRVRFGGGEPVQVVCGAANVRAGLKVAFAPVGSSLPGGGKLARARLRGIESHGMICSARELELGDDHAGILELPADAPPGRKLVDALGLRDMVLTLDNKSLTHRPDLWGHYGMAREIAALLRRPLRPLPVLERWPEDPAGVAIRLGDPEGCAMYQGLPLDLGGPPRPSPQRLRARLLAVGQRPRNDVVDLTNYVLFELGQPTHAFDQARLRGPEVVVRRARPGEKLTTLDGVERALAPEDLVIADAERVLALAGIMGGADTEVQAGTQRILLESAVFQPARVRRSAQRLALRTEASTRFEKSLDPALAELALRRFAHLLLQARPEARVLAAPAQAGAAAAPRLRLRLDPERVGHLLGLGLQRAEVAEPLRALGFGVEDSGQGPLQVDVPSWRATKDVTTPIDLVEEVGRMAGYQRIAPQPLVAPIAPPPQDPLRRLRRLLADRLSQAHQGYETQGYSFLERAWAARLHLPAEAFVRLHNPVQEGVDLLRRDPLPSLLQQAAGNVREHPAGLLFELAKGYEPQAAAGDPLPAERAWLGAVLWRPEPLPADGPRSLFGLARALAEDLLRSCGLSEVAGAQAVSDHWSAPWGHPARLLLWSAGGQTLGYSGAADPRLLDALGVRRTEVGVLLLDLQALAQAASGRTPSFVSPGKFPAIKVDVALALPENVPYAQVEQALQRAGGRLLEELRLFDVYAGAPLPAGTRSLAFHARLRAADRTLDEKDEQKFLERAGRAAEELGGSLRR